MNKNQAITKVPENQQTLPKDPKKIDQASKMISAVSDVVSTATNVFTTASDHTAKKDQQFITENCSQLPEKRSQIVDNALKQGTITWKEADEKLAAIEQDEISDIIRLMNARDESRTARACNAKNWGIGICCTTTGIGILVWLLDLAFGKKTA